MLFGNSTLCTKGIKGARAYAFVYDSRCKRFLLPHSALHGAAGYKISPFSHFPVPNLVFFPDHRKILLRCRRIKILIFSLLVAIWLLSLSIQVPRKWTTVGKICYIRSTLHRAFANLDNHNLFVIFSNESQIKLDGFKFFPDSDKNSLFQVRRNFMTFSGFPGFQVEWPPCIWVILNFFLNTWMICAYIRSWIEKGGEAWKNVQFNNLQHFSDIR